MGLSGQTRHLIGCNCFWLFCELNLSRVMGGRSALTKYIHTVLHSAPIARK